MGLFSQYNGLHSNKEHNKSSLQALLSDLLTNKLYYYQYDAHFKIRNIYHIRVHISYYAYKVKTFKKLKLLRADEL